MSNWKSGRVKLRTWQTLEVSTAHFQSFWLHGVAMLIIFHRVIAIPIGPIDHAAIGVKSRPAQMTVNFAVYLCRNQHWCCWYIHTLQLPYLLFCPPNSPSAEQHNQNQPSWTVARIATKQWNSIKRQKVRVTLCVVCWKTRRLSLLQHTSKRLFYL